MQDWQDMVDEAVRAKYWADDAREGVTPSDFKGWTRAATSRA